jgi:pimeloyl-ACP methyl ester carboxylesterase
MLKYFSVKENKISCWTNPHDFGAHAQSLIFIHGSGSNSSVWSQQYGRLHSLFNIAALNLPGHGQSGGNGGDDIPAYAEHVNDILSVLGLKRPVLIGHSMGAAIALCFAAKYPMAISGVITLGGGVTLPVNPDILQGLKSQPDMVLDMICKFSLAKENRSKLSDALRASLAAANLAVLASDMQACGKVDLTSELPKITAPVLAICGAQDKMTPPAFSEQITAKIKAAKLLLIEGAGHMVMMEKPEEVTAVIKTFCATVK